MRTLSIIAVAALVALPAGVNAQVIDSNTLIAAFVPESVTASLIVDWYGIGGTQQEPSGFLDGDLPGNNLDEAPDSCLDNDSQGMVLGNFFFLTPSLAHKNLNQAESALVPGNSVAAPPELIALCSTVRENIFGQPLGYEYPDNPQAVGHGDVNFAASNFALPFNEFDGAFTANPATLQARVCEMDIDSFAGTAPSDEGTEGAGIAFPNGVLLATAAACTDVTADILSFLCEDNCAGNEPEQWDPGTINEAGTTILWDLDLFELDVAFGLTGVCMKATVVDAANAVAGTVEDYGWFWVDGVENTYALAPTWGLPENSDGQAQNGDCSSIGIPL